MDAGAGTGSGRVKIDGHSRVVPTVVSKEDSGTAALNLSAGARRITRRSQHRGFRRDRGDQPPKAPPHWGDTRAGDECRATDDQPGKLALALERVASGD